MDDFRNNGFDPSESIYMQLFGHDTSSSSSSSATTSPIYSSSFPSPFPFSFNEVQSNAREPLADPFISFSSRANGIYAAASAPIASAESVDYIAPIGRKSSIYLNNSSDMRYANSGVEPIPVYTSGFPSVNIPGYGNPSDPDYAFPSVDYGHRSPKYSATRYVNTNASTHPISSVASASYGAKSPTYSGPSSSKIPRYVNGSVNSFKESAAEGHMNLVDDAAMSEIQLQEEGWKLYALVHSVPLPLLAPECKKEVQKEEPKKKPSSKPLQRSKWAPKKNYDRFCPFCHKNRERSYIFTAHPLKDDFGLVVCPVLMNYVCPNCQATGPYAHTISHCPFKPSMPTLRQLLATKFMSNGMPRIIGL